MAKKDRVNYSALWTWGRSSPRRMAFLLRVGWRLWLAERRRRRQQRQIDGLVPLVLAISPTMRCNYSCKGCYSRGRRTDNELSTDELDALFTEAEELGVNSIIVTGGEPFLRDDILDLMVRHRRLLFFPITNGSLVTHETARRVARSENIVLLISIEGFASDTDERRQTGAYEAAIHALERLRETRAVFGFVATNTAANTGQLGTDAFIDQMVAFGCAVGFFTEYVPCGLDPRPELVLDEAARAMFRQQVLDLRRRKPIVLGQFPHDEYGKENRCSGAGRLSLHINSQGGVEPCPFVSMAYENIRHGGLLAACQSPFLRVIRAQPNILRRERYACSLFEHHAELDSLARQFSEDEKPSLR